MNTKEHTLHFKFPWSGSVWLFLELIVITVVAWVVIDPAVVNLYYMNQPVGYDSDRLVLTEIKRIYNSDGTGSANAMEQMNEYLPRLVEKLKATDDIENVYGYENPYSALSHRYGGLRLICRENDTIGVSSVTFVDGQHFFETYGIKPMLGSLSAEQLSQITEQDKQVVLTRSGAIALFGTADVVGRRFTCHRDEPCEVTVAGVVEDFRKSVSSTLRSLIMMPGELSSTQGRYFIRLREGIDAHRFVEEHGQDIIRSGKTSFNRISRLMTFNDWLQKQELDRGRTQEVNRSLALALFFLINVMLAVVGTVWLHAKRHTEECGVRRAFGATRRRVLWSFLWRNAFLATVAVTVGLIIYLNYAHSGIQVYNGEEYYETLYTTCSGIDLPTDKTWVDHFWPHFLIVSGVVYIIILCTVLIGTAIPAIKIINTRITNSLRE